MKDNTSKGAAVMKTRVRAIIDETNRAKALASQVRKQGAGSFMTQDSALEQEECRMIDEPGSPSKGRMQNYGEPIEQGKQRAEIITP